MKYAMAFVLLAAAFLALGCAGTQPPPQISGANPAPPVIGAAPGAQNGPMMGPGANNSSFFNDNVSSVDDGQGYTDLPLDNGS